MKRVCKLCLGSTALILLGSCVRLSSYVEAAERRSAESRHSHSQTLKPELTPERYAAAYADACARMHAEPKTRLEFAVKTPHPKPATRTLPAALRRIFVEHMGYLQGCYQQALRLHPNATGRMTLRFGIASSGRVEAATVFDNQVGIEPMGCCIADRAVGWRFPPPEGGGPIVVNYTLWFVVRETPQAYAAIYAPACARMRAGPKTPLEFLVKAPDSPEAQRAAQAHRSDSLSEAVVQRVVADHMDELRACYYRAPLGVSGAGDQVDVRFGIAASGQVEAASVLRNDTGIEAMDCCIVDRMLRWRFPPPEGGASLVVTQSLELRPQAQTDSDEIPSTMGER
jgi:hypothetical protein